MSNFNQTLILASILCVFAQLSQAATEYHTTAVFADPIGY